MSACLVLLLLHLRCKVTELWSPIRDTHLFYFRATFSATFSAIFTISIIQIAGAPLVHVLYTNFLFKEFWFFSSPTSSTVAVAMKICSIFLLAAICTTSRGMLPHYLPATRGNALAQDKLIETYINLGFAAQETVLFLASVRGFFLV